MAAAAACLQQCGPGLHTVDTADGMGFTLLHRQAHPEHGSAALMLPGCIASECSTAEAY